MYSMVGVMVYMLVLCCVCSDRKNEIITETKEELEQVRNNVHKLQQEVCIDVCVCTCMCVCMCMHVCVCVYTMF